MGIRRILELVQRQWFCRGMRGDLISYVRPFPVFLFVKPENRPKVGLLQPLEIPTKTYVQVTTDLATDLLDSNSCSIMAVFSAD